MAQPPSKQPLSEADFDAIAEAVNETERGRWFLAEYARRNRHADTRLVLDAIEKLEKSLVQRASTLSAEQIRNDLFDMSQAIARTKAEIAAIKPEGEGLNKIEDATVELGAIVETTEKATSDILAAAESVQEIAWTLREQGLDPSVCDSLDAHMTQTYTACSFQDLTGQRIRKIVNVLDFLEARIEAMKKIWMHHETPAAAAPAEPPASLTNGPPRPGEGLEQNDIDGILGLEAKPETDAAAAEDDIFWEEAPLEEKTGDRSETPADIPAASAPPVAPTGERSAADPIERLSAAERLALFS